jgi:beta-glucoside operon transcriptional antiterminator
MKVLKIINNNIVSALDKDGNEVVAMGKGLGFKYKLGKRIKSEEIEKIFRMDNQDSMERFINLVKNLPLEYIELVDEIISFAKEKLENDLSEMLYLTLTDHISFVIDQIKENRKFANMLHEEVKQFYSNEYEVGLYGIRLIYKKTGFRLPDDEAAAIALHIVNAEFNMTVRDSLVMTNIMRDMLQMIEDGLQIESMDSMIRGWLTINLKFLAYRMLRLPPDTNEADFRLLEFLENHYREECELAENICRFIREKYNCEMTEEEKLYLVLHIGRRQFLHKRK